MKKILRGQPGKILTTTDARGVEIDKLGETREKPIEGKSLMISLDVNIQEFAQQSALKSNGGKAGRTCIYPADESTERRNICMCQCAGI